MGIVITILNSKIFANLMQLFIAFFGSAAFLTYWWQKRRQIKTAATLILNQIDEAEKIVDLMRKPENIDNRVLYKTPEILAENYWQEYKVLLMRYLSNSDVEVIERYYANIKLVQKGKDRIMADLSEAWKCRSAEYNAILKEISELKATNIAEDDLEAQKALSDSIKQKEKVLYIYFHEDRIFRAGVGLDMLKNGLECFESIKGTSVYQLLEKKSYRK
ncbi:MAG: hypothetical protein ACI4F1_13130 [Bariatricus sp.]